MSADALYGALHPDEDEPRSPLYSLADALSELAACAFSLASGRTADAADFHLEARVAAGDAFPLGSEESAALNVLLTAIAPGVRT